MTDKEIRHLGKTELLNIIRDQEAELEQLRTQITQFQTQISSKTIRMEKCGSIAEAAMQINQVFQAAQAAADQYIASVHAKGADAEAAASQMEMRAREMADAKIRDAEENCQQMERESRKKSAEYWEALQVQLEQFYKSHLGLKEMLAASGFDVQIPNREGMK